MYLSRRIIKSLTTLSKKQRNFDDVTNEKAYTVARKQRGVSLEKVLKVNSRKLWLNY
jgi:hypothetical protein